MAKRSPIAGYNHNVRYRGLIFHVQTEDSGLQSPHLFTHMFYGGVIISTRKLVYDAGSSEDAIKGLMQSQHKIVLKDLKRGSFDDKIDQYLAGTEGLLPRGAVDDGAGERPTGALQPSSDPSVEPLSEPDVPRASDPAHQLRMSEPEIILERPGTDHDITPEMLEPAEEPAPRPAIARTATPPPIPIRAQTNPVVPAAAAPMPARTRTAERKSAPSSVRSSLPPPPPSPDEIDPPTLNDHKDSIAAAFEAANATTRTETIQDSGPEIRLELEDSDPPERSRVGRDTDVEVPALDGRNYSDGIPGQIGASSSGRAGDSIPPLPPPPERRTGDRGSAVSASTLPPARPIARPPSRQAISPPTVMSRPLTNDDARNRADSDAIEVYAPPPSSVDPPPGERPGQYAQHKRVSQRLPADGIRNERERTGTGSQPIPSGLARPGRTAPVSTSPGSGGIPQRITREPSPSQPQPHGQTQPMHSRAQSSSAAPDSQRNNNDLASRPQERPRTPTPARVSGSNPTPSRSPSSNSGGVVMTRPAVIVGAPAKPAAPKVRKAREEEGRGFGQGLISEKSLDEVILAYLSEDADDK